jgi:hypothetical protein
MRGTIGGHAVAGVLVGPFQRAGGGNRTHDLTITSRLRYRCATPAKAYRASRKTRSIQITSP